MQLFKFSTEHNPLMGTYTQAYGPEKGTLILLPGSGPITRDGVTINKRIPWFRPPFVMWAEILSRAGYASFRYDKRAAAYPHLYQTGEEVCLGIADEYLNDLTQALAMLKKNNLLHHPVILLGHSLGAIAALAFTKMHQQVQAVAAISAPIEDLSSAIKRQLLHQLSTEAYDQLVTQLNQALTGTEVGPVLGLPAVYWRDYARYSLEQLLLQSTQPPSFPVLLLHGTRDLQVPIEQVLPLQQKLIALNNLQWRIIPGGNHFLMIRPPADFNDGGDYMLHPLLEWLEQLPATTKHNNVAEV